MAFHIRGGGSKWDFLMGVADTDGPPNYMLIYLVFGNDEMETVTLQSLEKPNKIEKIEANRNTLLT